VLTGRVRIDDGTGLADVIFSDIDEQALPILKLSDLKDQMLKNHECQVPLSKGQISTLVGREIEVYGIAKQLAGNGKYELIAEKVLLANAF
jgi:ssDNA-binding replication factor A large subunit